MKKKLLIITISIITIIIILALITSYKDNARVRAGLEPKYTIKIINDKSTKVTYIGLGYKVIRYVGVSPYEPFGMNDNYKYGSWFMKYENPDENIIKLEEIQEYINDYIENVKKDKNFNYSYSYIDTERKKVVVGLLDNSTKKQDEFINNVFTKCCGSKYIKNIKENNYIEFTETKETFKAKVLENKNNSILVEVINKTKSFNQGDKVVVNIPNYISKNMVYEKEMIVTISFNGMINESYPPQITTTDISLDINDYNKK